MNVNVSDTLTQCLLTGRTRPTGGLLLPTDYDVSINNPGEVATTHYLYEVAWGIS